MIRPDDLESKVKDVVKKALKARGAWWFMPNMNGMGTSGVPDFVGCHGGKFFAVECKRPKLGAKGLTALQRLQISSIDAAGGKTFVVWDDITVRKLEEWLDA